MIIGLVGKMRSGKDTVGKIIQWLTGINRHIPFTDWLNSEYDAPFNSNWEIVKFADKLKEAAELILGIPNFIEKWDKNENDWRNTDLGDEWEHTYYTQVNQNKIVERYTPRTFVQTLGTDCGRNVIHPNIWVNATMSNYRGHGAVKSPRHGTIDEKLSNPDWEETDYPDWIITDVRFPNELEAITDRGGMVIHVDRDADRDSDMELHESETSLDDYKFEHVIDNNGTLDELIHKVHEFLHNGLQL